MEIEMPYRKPEEDVAEQMFADQAVTLGINVDYSPPRKIIVETDKMHPSGTKGGTPMFSKAGVYSTMCELKF